MFRKNFSIRNAMFFFCFSLPLSDRFWEVDIGGVGKGTFRKHWVGVFPGNNQEGKVTERSR